MSGCGFCTRSRVASCGFAQPIPGLWSICGAKQSLAAYRGSEFLYAPFVKEPEDYLKRLALADLFLDTLPYNAHATAMDALWAGLPVLTRPVRPSPDVWRRVCSCPLACRSW
jgi:hypothetical protein